MTASVLFVVPARGGSKRLPGKNLAEIGGYSLVERAVMQGIEASQRYTDSAVVLTTDSSEIAAVVEWTGCEVIDRPAELASDEAQTADVVLHACGVLPCVMICLLQPTSPMRTVEDIHECIMASLEHAVPVWTRKRSAPVPSGSVYVTAPSVLEAGVGFTGHPGQGVMVDGGDLDIDTAEDLQEAREAWASRSSQS